MNKEIIEEIKLWLNDVFLVEYRPRRRSKLGISDIRNKIKELEND